MKTAGKFFRLMFAAAMVEGCSFAAQSASDLRAPIILGVLEENAESWGSPARVGTTYSRHVRTVFRKESDLWRAFPSECGNQACLKTAPSKFPQRIKWTIAFEGTALGQICGRTQPEFKYYSDIGWQDIVSTTLVPTLGRRSIDYGGFLGTPVFRPLIAISQPNFKDPDHWRLATLSSGLTERARLCFRQRFKKACNCRNPDENIQRPWRYHDSDIVIGKSYFSSRYGYLIQMNLGDYRCDGPLENKTSPFENQWFLLSTGGTVRFLDSGMWLVGAGDFDKSGESQLLFCIDQYNRGGYELFYDNLARHSVFQFQYH